MAELDDPLEPFEVDLFGKTFSLEPRKDLAIDQDELVDQWSGQPAMFGHYSVIADMAQNTLEAWQVALQQKESELYEKFVEEGAVKQTEESLKKAVRGHEEYHEIQENLVNASFMAAKMRSLVNAFVDRRFCMQGLQGRLHKTIWQEGDMVATHQRPPKPVAVNEHRTLGAFPGKKKGI